MESSLPPLSPHADKTMAMRTEVEYLIVVFMVLSYNALWSRGPRTLNFCAAVRPRRQPTARAMPPV